MPAGDDGALVAACRQGDQAAWATLVDRYHDRGSDFVERTFNGDWELAADLMQEVWEDLVLEMRREAPRHFKSLFWTMVRRRAIDEIRRRGRRPLPASLDAGGPDDEGLPLLERIGSDQPGPEAASLALEQARALQAALDQLPEHYRVTVVSRDIEGRSNKETAGMLQERGLLDDSGSPEKRAENYYYRGLKALREIMQAEGG